MSDIFLSYANAELSRVQPLIAALERRGWSVWWDRTILPGKTYDHVNEGSPQQAAGYQKVSSPCKAELCRPQV